MTGHLSRRETTPPLVHLHVQKTAGTSVRRVLADHFGANNLLYYDYSCDKVIRSSHRIVASERSSVDNIKSSAYKHGLFSILRPAFRFARSLEQQLAFEPEHVHSKRFLALSGHFSGEDLETWGLSGHPVITIVRDPLARTRSHYEHWIRTKGFANADKIADLPYSPDVSFEAFALQPSLSNYQSRMIGNASIKAIGTIETLPALLEEVGLPAPATTPHLNSSLETNHQGLSNTAARLFETMNRDDYVLVTNAQEGW